MTLDSVLAFWGVCALLIAVPGADWAFVVGAGLRGQSVVPAVAGLVPQGRFARAVGDPAAYPRYLDW